MNGGLRALLKSLGPALGLAATWILFALLAGANFSSWSNHQLMLLQTAVVGTAAIGATWIIIAGGIDVERSKLALYALAVACAGVAAVLQFSYLSMGDPTTAQGYELKVIAAVVIGGASLSGGQGSIVGTLIGALIMTVVDNGCTKLGLDNWVQELVTGGIIVAAVALDRLRQRGSE